MTFLILAIRIAFRNTADKIKNVDRLKSQKLNTFSGQLPGAGRQNRVQNRHLSENRRWGPYKNHKNVTKYRSTTGNC